MAHTKKRPGDSFLYIPDSSKKPKPMFPRLGYNRSVQLIAIMAATISIALLLVFFAMVYRRQQSIATERAKGAPPADRLLI